MQITDYIRSILLFMIFITFVGIIVPNSKYKKYIDLVTGLILILIVAKPVATLMNGGQIPVHKLFAEIEEVTPSSAEMRDYKNLQYEMLKKTYDDLAIKQMQSLLDKEGKYQILSAELQTSEDLGQIEHISMFLQAVETSHNGKPFIWIEPIRIGAGEISAENGEEPEIKYVKKIISNFYNLSPDNIHITVQKKNVTGDEKN